MNAQPSSTAPPKVLISRIQSLLKRTRQQVDTNIISYNEIVLNKEKMLALYRDGYEDGMELMPKLKAFLEEE